MQANQKVVRKPLLSNHGNKNVDPYDRKLAKVDIFYRYHIASIYRQLKMPIYEKLLSLRKEKKPQNLPMITRPVEELVQLLYKYASLNSKYRHREKMRFERTPLLKYIQCKLDLQVDDFQRLRQLLKDKNHMKIYEDLSDQDEDDDDQPKKQYQKDNSFTQQSLLNFKRKNGIEGKVVIALGYEDLKKGLVELGWTQNEEVGSLLFDLKFMSKKKNIDYVNLQDSQYINHFQQNKAITAKFGLARNIRNLASLGKDSTAFFPRCYDMNDVAELEDFYEDFKYTQLKAYLFQFIANGGKIWTEQVKLMKLIISILSKELMSIEKKIDHICKGRPLFITSQQWNTISEWASLKKGEQIIEQGLLKEAQQLFQNLKENDPQWHLNKDNIWIVKPASMSRGRGIKTFNSLPEILDYVAGCQISWVAQKYIERPLIVKRKKFDIRQWVLWTDFKPLRVWIFEECYTRFCAEIYAPEDLRNRKIHLTNNSVTKGVNSENDGIDGNMLDENDFGNQLEKMYGKEVFKSIIKPQMLRIISQSLESVLENVQYRRNSFEILGYDFMIDQQLKMWLIEVNSSPTMEYSTKVTSRLVQKGMGDLAMVIQNYITKGKQYKSNQSKELYGGWKLIPQQ